MSISWKYYIGPIKQLTSWTYENMFTFILIKKMKTKIIMRHYCTSTALKIYQSYYSWEFGRKRETYEQLWRWKVITPSGNILWGEHPTTRGTIPKCLGAAVDIIRLFTAALSQKTTRKFGGREIGWILTTISL